MRDEDKRRDQLFGGKKTLRGHASELGGLEAGRKEAEESLPESGEMYRNLVTISPDAVTVTDLEGRITEVSKGTLELHGFDKAEEIIGRNAFEFLAPEDHDKARQNLQRTLEKGLVRNVEYSLQRKDGTRFIGEISASLVRDAHGKPKAFVAITRDVTDRKDTEKELREREAKYRELVQNANSIILRFDTKGRITFFNEFAQSFFGYEEGEILGQNVVGTIVPETDTSGQDLAAMIKDLLQRPEEYVNNENENIRSNGERVWVAWTNKAVSNDSGCVVEILAIGNDITDHKRAEEALRESEEKFRLISEQSMLGIALIQDGYMKYANQTVAEIVGYSVDEMLRWDTNEFSKVIHPDDRSFTMEQAQKKQRGEEEVVVNYSSRIITKDRKTKWIELYSKAIVYDGKYADLVTLIDITEQKRLEAQLLWSQKMETVGRLAGGVAHDFNNLLTTIIGYTELGMMRLHPSDPMYSDLGEILKASERAARLTQQFLTFSRRQVIEPKVVSLNKILHNTDKMLRRILGEDIDLTTLLAEDLGLIKVDPGQMEQVIVNLSVNARDAMPNGGKLTIETAAVTLDEAYAGQHVTVSPGDYVMLAISDTGIGMTDEAKAHLFEPFFTTKEVGKGTGLGLATCYGIVKQSGGNIWVYSELGKGTTFKIYLPRVEKEAARMPKRDESGYLPGGTETVLLVEDDPSVRGIGARMLREQGYRVLEGATGEEALRLARKHGGEWIDLLLTDIVMPQMSGKELARRLRTGRPDLKVLFLSGYTDETMVRHGVLDSGAAFLQKPFSPAQLSRKVREVLNR